MKKGTKMDRVENLLSYLNPLHLQGTKTKQEFNNWYEFSKLFQIRAITILTAILYIIYSQIDVTIAPKSLLPLMTFIHFYMLPLSLFFISSLTLGSRFNRLTNFLLIVAPIGAVMGNLLIEINVNNPSPYLSELYLIIIWTFTISGLRLSHALISATITSIIILLFSYYFLALPKNILSMHFLWILSAFSFGLLSAFILERSNKIIFLNEKQLEKLATTDKLTGLYNRLKIENIFEIEVERARRYKRFFSIILVDIDNFKHVNDNYGHHTGDTVLKEFSLILKNGVRKVDFVSRWGGEEFLIILPQTNIEETEKVAQNLRKNIENFKFTLVDNQTGSFGLSYYRDNDTIQNLLNRADRALYIAKENGKNQVQIL